MCYTSGTTGNPKGVVYSHRSMVLHSWMLNFASTIGLTARDAVLPVVPMFHANAWGCRTRPRSRARNTSTRGSTAPIPPRSAT